MYTTNDFGNLVRRSLQRRRPKTLLLSNWTPSSHDFPLVCLGFKNRFQMLWLEEFECLNYSEIHECECCKWCVTFALEFNSAEAPGLLVKSSQTNWRKVNDYNSHKTRQYLQLCALKFDAFLTLFKIKGNVDVRNMLSINRKNHRSKQNST